MSDPVYRRILLKLSGEALAGKTGSGIDANTIKEFASEISELCNAGVQIGLVLGGGNILRGAEQASQGLERVTGDHMGMLATVINALAMQDALESLGQKVRVMSALKIHQVCEDYIRRRAVSHLDQGRIVIFAAGIGNPFFTTDSAASLRAIEINADILIKATKVNGVYSADPMKYANAEFYPRVTYDQAITQKLNVMDATALVLCRDENMPVRVMNIFEKGALKRLIEGEEIGSLMVAEGE